ncbi:ExbD/TolR family protein [Plebeiibacterium sediminum]|uniref:Uncharacterized protein n=1 Tax=Plebeiibacterium sediminum TaxID=2992112 RepID=A0AAE3M269_9BACT|nr:hypothetical protein [Plebeiobacterium sediminum]MCW3785759.1 hypothetical protein [Plebeiobacterium sediminum]
MLIIIASFYSCSKDNNQIIGKWIEADNYTNYVTLDIGEYSYHFADDNWPGERLYHLNKDTIYNNGINKINKSIYKIVDGKLSFYDIDSLNPSITYERNIYSDCLDYFNSKKKTSIQLPHLNISQKYIGTYQNSLYADYKNKELRFYINGNPHEISDTSYQSLNNLKQTKSRLFIDKDLPLGTLNQIKRELQKAQMNSVGYAAYNTKDSISFVNFLLPPVDLPGVPVPSRIPDSILKLNITNIVVEIYPKKILVNGTEVDIQNFKNDVKRRLEKLENEVIRLYCDDNLMYETYITTLYQIQSAYYELRNEYAFESYNVDDYSDLDHDDRMITINKYPMKIHEIDKTKLMELHDKHLY